jgi:hypothetical protein
LIIKSCVACEFHEVKLEDKASYCEKENCWAKFSKCVAKRALARYLEEEEVLHGRGAVQSEDQKGCKYEIPDSFTTMTD